MTGAKFDMSDYVPVNERIESFKAEWPDGSLQSSIVELTESRVTIKAYAYRHPDDQRPGIGHSSLEIPGATPYTRGSEIENAETSAWGRAIAALGFEVKRGLASREEVRNKQSEQGGRSHPSGGATPATRPAPAQRTAEEQELLDELLAIPGMTHARMSLLADAVGIPEGERANADQLREMLARSAIELPEPAAVPTPVAPADPSVAPVAEDEGQAGSSDPPASPTDTAPADAVTSAAPTPAAGASPRSDVPPAATYSPETFRTLLAAVLELDVAGDWKLTDLDATDWSTIWTALGVAEIDAYKAWHARQPREIRAALASAKQSPRARADAAKAEPVQESMNEALGNPVEGSES